MRRVTSVRIPLSTKLSISALRLLPRNVISRFVGRLVSLRLPQPLQRWQIRCFAAVFGVDLGEVRDPIDSFTCLQDFFVRALVAGTRPIDPAADALVSPCDGSWGESGVIRDGLLLQLKGRAYSLAGLLGDAAAAERFEGGRYATFYLSPRDYHRFHAPCEVRVSGLRYIPGTLWPVNRLGIEGIDAIFSQNERICAFMDPQPRIGNASLVLVAVGATMVGKVRVTFDTLTTNRRGAKLEERDYGSERPVLVKGQEWGRFEFGSTLVLLGAKGAFELDAAAPGTVLRLGERIGRLLR